MKKITLIITIFTVLALAACGHKSDAGGASQGTGGAVATPAKSNVDSTLDTPKMPAHVDSATKK